MNKVCSLPEYTDSFQDKNSKEKKALTKTRSIKTLSTVQLIILMSTILMRILQPQLHLDEVP